jgi:hypothetical protein
MCSGRQWRWRPSRSTGRLDRKVGRPFARHLLSSLNFSDEKRLIIQPDLMAMDERRTLSILGWTIGGVVATVFVLNRLR